MRLTLAAVGAVVAALLQLTIVRYLQVGGAEPDLLLVFAVATVVAGDLEGGLVWAFLGGLMLDVLVPRPLGLTAFTLLAAVGLASVLAKVLDRTRLFAAPLATFPTSIVTSGLFVLAYGILRGPVPVADPVGAVLPTALYSTVVALAVGPLVVRLRQRAAVRERVAW